MAKVKEVAGVIGETLRLPPEVVKSHVAGLMSAERLETECGANGAADLLSACLSTDPTNATGPFHLPFAGAFLTDRPDSEFVVAPGNPHFSTLSAVAPTFGEGLRNTIEGMSSGVMPLNAVMAIDVTGQGSRLRATITLTAVLDGSPSSIVALFGNAPITDHLQELSKHPEYIERTSRVSGQVLARLADLFSGLPYEGDISTFGVEARAH